MEIASKSFHDRKSLETSEDFLIMGRVIHSVVSICISLKYEILHCFSFKYENIPGLSFFFSLS